MAAVHSSPSDARKTLPMAAKKPSNCAFVTPLIRWLHLRCQWACRDGDMTPTTRMRQLRQTLRVSLDACLSLCECARVRGGSVRSPGRGGARYVAAGRKQCPMDLASGGSTGQWRRSAMGCRRGAVLRRAARGSDLIGASRPGFARGGARWIVIPTSRMPPEAVMQLSTVVVAGGGGCCCGQPARCRRWRSG